MTSPNGAAAVSQFPIVRYTAHACEVLEASTHRVVADTTDVFAQKSDHSIGSLLEVSHIQALRRVNVTEDHVRMGATTT